MTKRDLIDEIVKLYPSYSRRDAEVIVSAVFESMTEALCSGERIEIRGFGSFVVKQRRAREGRNPKTGEIVAVAAKRVPFFKVGKELKQRVDGEAADGATADGSGGSDGSESSVSQTHPSSLTGGSSSV
jgi:integration host factor beta subunit